MSESGEFTKYIEKKKEERFKTYERSVSDYEHTKVMLRELLKSYSFKAIKDFCSSFNYIYRDFTYAREEEMEFKRTLKEESN